MYVLDSNGGISEAKFHLWTRNYVYEFNVLQFLTAKFLK